MPQPPALEELVDFPTVFTFRVVALATESLKEEVKGLVESSLDRPIMNMGEQESSGGKFTAVRVTATVIDADEIRRTYAALQGVSNLKMLL